MAHLPLHWQSVHSSHEAKDCSIHPKIECIVTTKIYIKIKYILYNDYVLMWQDMLKKEAMIWGETL